MELVRGAFASCTHTTTRPQELHWLYSRTGVAQPLREEWERLCAGFRPPTAATM